MSQRARYPLFLSGAAAVFLLGFYLDGHVRSLFHFPDSRWLHGFMEAASYYGRGWSLSLLSVLVIVMGILLKKTSWSNTGLVCLFSLLASAFVVQLLKHLAGRARPRLLESAFMFTGPSLTASGTGFDSFPSGHAITTFALAVIFARSFSRGKFLFYGVALLVCYSRIYMGAHFASDIVVGAILGLVIGHLSLSHAGRILPFTDRLERNKGLVSAVAVVGLASFLFFHQLKAVPLFDVDEAVFAEATREMMETGSWMTPLYNYAPRYDKPILFYWLMASAYAVFGASEFAARFWPALAGCALVAMTFFFARATACPRAALLSALILATSVEMIALSRMAITDMVLTFFIAASLYSFYFALTHSGAPHSGRWALIGWAAAGLAVLTKGPIGILFPIVIAFLFLSLSGKYQARSALRPAAGVALFCFVALPWYALAAWTTNGEFLEVFLGKHNVERYLLVNSGHKGPLYYYLIVILAGFFPWSAFLPVAIKSAWQKRRASSAQERQDDLPLFLLLWIAVVLVFFSLAQTKLPNYVAPLFPAMSLLVGWWLDRHVLNGGARREAQEGVRREATGAREKRKHGARAPALVAGAASLIIAAGVVLSYVFLDTLQARFFSAADMVFDPGLFPLFLTAVFAGFAIGFFLLAKAETVAQGFAALAVCMVIFAFGLIEGLLPRVSWRLQEPLRAISLDAAGRFDAGTRLIVFGLNNPSILFYSKRPALLIGSDDFTTLKEKFHQPVRFLIITRASLVEKFPREMHLYPLERRANYVLLSNRPD